MDEPETAKVIEVIRSGNGGNGTALNGSVTKAVAILTGVAALVLMVRGYVEPLGQRQDGIEDRLERIEQRTNAGLAATDTKIKLEIAGAREAMAMGVTRSERRLADIEEWLVWWNRTIQPRDTQQDARLDALEKAIIQNRQGP